MHINKILWLTGISLSLKHSMWNEIVCIIPFTCKNIIIIFEKIIFKIFKIFIYYYIIYSILQFHII